jgi:hypothetical protein
MADDYYGEGTYECIKVIRAWELNFELGNVLKYVKRAGHKNPRTRKKDLRKAIAYLEMEIARPTRRRKPPEPEGPLFHLKFVDREGNPTAPSRAPEPEGPTSGPPISLEARLEELFAEGVPPLAEEEEEPSATAVDLVALRYDEPQEAP